MNMSDERGNDMSRLMSRLTSLERGAVAAVIQERLAGAKADSTRKSVQREEVK